MKRSRILAGVTATLLVLVVVFRAVLTEDRGPRELMNDAREHMDDALFDERAALLDLSVALDGARRAGDEPLGSEILRLRAEILLELGARLEARQALVQALEEFDPQDRALELSIVELCDQDGDEVEASQRLDRLIEKDPEFGPAWVLRGRILERSGAERLEQAKHVIRGRLLEREQDRALELIDRLGRLDPDLAERDETLIRLRELLGPRKEDDFEQVANLANEACQLRVDARYAQSQSFLYGIEAEAAAALVRAISRAGEPRWAIQLGATTRFDPRVRHDWRVASAMLAAMTEVGDTSRMQELLRQWNWEEWPGSAEFYEQSCIALYESGAWHLLTEPIARLRLTGGDRGARLGAFFAGMVAYGRNQNAQALDILRTYVRENRSYYPDDIATASYALADIYRDGGRGRDERTSLETATALLPDADGEAWLRLAQLTIQASHAGYREAEIQWTHGMNLLPERTAENMTQWLTLSDESLQADRRSFDDAVRMAKEQGSVLPAFEIGPATLYRFGTLALEQGRHEVALRLARMLLDDYPTLLPAVDLAFDAHMAMRERREAAGMVLHRLALVGRDPETLARLARVGAENFSVRQVVQAMRADPSRTGRLVIARALNQAGKHEQALTALDREPVGEARADAEQRLETARALFGLERHAAAREKLAGIVEHPVLGPEAMDVEVELALAAGTPEEITQLVQRLTQPNVQDRELVLHFAEELAKRGDLDVARTIAQSLDEKPQLRGGDLVMLLARIEMAAGNDDAAEEALDRADAFDLQGRVELARVLLAIDQRRWLELPALVARVRATNARLEPLQNVLFALLEERLEEGMTLARDGLEARPHQAEWLLAHAAVRSLVGEPTSLDAHFGGEEYADQLQALLRGRDENVRDPREVLALLLVLDAPEWAPWTMPRIERLDPGHAGSIWPVFLATRVTLARGDLDEAQRRLDYLVRTFPRFGPAWDLLEQLLIANHGGERFDPAVNALRAQRAESSGEPADPLLASIGQAVELEQGGELEAARALLDEALSARPEETTGREVLARLDARCGLAPQAVAQYVRAISGAEGASATKLVEELLDLLRAERADPELTLDGRREVLRSLDQQFPTLPRIAVARAELELERDPNKPESALPRALEILEQSRIACDYRPLDELEPGSTSRWVSFLVEHTPGEAEALVRAELDADPGSVDLWLALAEIHERTERPKEALALYLDVAAMSADSRAHLGVARLLGHLEEGSRDVERHLSEAERNGDATIRTQVEFYRAEMHIGRDGIPPDPIVNILSRLYEQQATTDTGISPLELGNGLAFALFTRREPDDLAQLDGLLRELERHATRVLADDYLRTLHGLATHLEPKAPPPGRPERKTEEPDAPAGESVEETVEDDQAPPPAQPETKKRKPGGKKKPEGREGNERPPRTKKPKQPDGETAPAPEGKGKKGKGKGKGGDTKRNAKKPPAKRGEGR